MIDAMYENWVVWFLYFSVAAAIGWVIESTFRSITEHHWVNSGFLSGPFIPIIWLRRAGACRIGPDPGERPLGSLLANSGRYPDHRGICVVISSGKDFWTQVVGLFKAAAESSRPYMPPVLCVLGDSDRADDPLH